MKTFQVQKDNFEKILPFVDLAAAEAHWNYLQPCIITEVYLPVKTDAEKLAERKEFGQSLVDRYLLQNDAIAAARGYPLTVAESDQQTAKFASIMMILPIGSLRQALAKIQAVAVDTIYTQDRKDADILDLTNFIAAQ
jgi:hypothetical protein